jgi:radical SAM protein with 4Fe4S-binding SPASM domain
VKAIAALAQRFPVTVNCVIQNRNLESLPDLVARLNDLGVRKIRLELERRYSEDQLVQTAKLLDIRSNQLPRASENGDRDYSFEQLEEVMKACIQRAQDGGLYLVFHPSFLAVRLRSCYYNQTRLEVPCICKRMQTATIAPNGDLLFCSIIRKPIGNLTQSCLEDLWNSPSAISLRKIMLENNMTHLCENCPGLVPVGDLRCGSGKWTKARGW